MAATVCKDALRGAKVLTGRRRNADYSITMAGTTSGRRRR
jgi:hypothetical protein